MTPPTSTSSPTEGAAAAARATLDRLVETWGRPNSPRSVRGRPVRQDRFFRGGGTAAGDRVRDRDRCGPLRAAGGREHPRQHTLALRGSRIGSITSRPRWPVAELRFRHAGLSGLVTTVGGGPSLSTRRRPVSACRPRRRAAQARDGLHHATRGRARRHDDGGSLLALRRTLLGGLSLRPEDLDGLILVTQTPDYSSPSTAISLQHRLGLRTDTLCFDMRLGCSGFVYGLSVAYSLVESGLSRVLLCVGDVASRMVAADDRAITPSWAMQAPPSWSSGATPTACSSSTATGRARRPCSSRTAACARIAEDRDKPASMHMDGAQVFNFTLKRVPPLITDILAAAGMGPEEPDFYVCTSRTSTS